MKAYVYGRQSWKENYLHLEVVNVSLCEGKMAPAFEEAVVHALLKGLSFNTAILDNFATVSNLPFLENMLEVVMGDQLQSQRSRFTRYLSVFQSIQAWPYERKKNLWRMSWMFPNAIILVGINTINHGILMDCCSGWGHSSAVALFPLEPLVAASNC